MQKQDADIIADDICGWIASKGGHQDLNITELFEIIDSYIFQIPLLGFTLIPTINEIFGTIDYYLGFNGDDITGCSFAHIDLKIINTNMPTTIKVRERYTYNFDLQNIINVAGYGWWNIYLYVPRQSSWQPFESKTISFYKYFSTPGNYTWYIKCGYGLDYYDPASETDTYYWNIEVTP